MTRLHDSDFHEDDVKEDSVKTGAISSIFFLPAMSTTPSLVEQLGLSEAEKIWSLNYDVFLQRGYKLRERYKPGVVELYLGLVNVDVDDVTEEQSAAIVAAATNAGLFDAADFDSIYTQGIDATRLSDGSNVWIKRYDLRESDNADMVPEFGFNFLLTTEHVTPDNHCLPLLDHFTTQSEEALRFSNNQRILFLVFPWGLLAYTHPWRLAAEALEFVRQMLEGLAFLHLRGIAHRDIHFNNIVVDPRPIFPKGIDPRRAYIGYINFEDPSPCLDRIAVPVKYYFIDMEITVNVAKRGERVKWMGGLHKLPEVFGTTNPTEESIRNPPSVMYDPFAGDVWQLGMTLHLFFGKSIPSICPLLRAMTQRLPEDRPTAQECLEQFHAATNGLSRWELLWPVLDASSWREGRPRKRVLELDCLHFRDWARLVVKALREGLCKPEQMKRLADQETED